MIDSLSPTSAMPAGDAAAAAVAWRFEGRTHVTAIAKATFAFAVDAAMPRVRAHEILRADAHHGNNPMRSAHTTSDLAPRLDRADVVFSGSAHAPASDPQGARASALVVRLGIFEGARAVLDKVLWVRDPAGARQIPIVYERAFGGMQHPDNPVGVGATPGTSEPSILDPADPRRTIGLGPIARSWFSRRHLLGGTPRSRLDGPVLEIPEGFDWSYFQAAPIDQRLDRLRGDEWIVMDGLHSEHARIRMRLPGAHAKARVYGLSAHGLAEGHEIMLTADTLRIDGDDQTCSVVWRQSFPLPEGAALASVRIVAGVALPEQPIPWPDRTDVGSIDIHGSTLRGHLPIGAAAATGRVGNATMDLSDDEFELSDGDLELSDDQVERLDRTMYLAEDGYPAEDGYLAEDGAPRPGDVAGSLTSPSGGDTMALPAEMIALLASPPSLETSAPARRQAAPVPAPAASISDPSTTLIAAPVSPMPTDAALPFRSGAVPTSAALMAGATPRPQAISTGTLFLPDDSTHAEHSPLPFSEATKPAPISAPAPVPAPMSAPAPISVPAPVIAAAPAPERPPVFVRPPVEIEAPPAPGPAVVAKPQRLMPAPAALAPPPPWRTRQTKRTTGR